MIDDKRDYYAEVRDLIGEWAEDLGGNIDSVRADVEDILDDAEGDFT